MQRRCGLPQHDTAATDKLAARVKPRAAIAAAFDTLESVMPPHAHNGANAATVTATPAHANATIAAWHRCLSASMVPPCHAARCSVGAEAACCCQRQDPARRMQRLRRRRRRSGQRQRYHCGAPMRGSCYRMVSSLLTRLRRDSPTPRDSSSTLPWRPGSLCAAIASFTRCSGNRCPAAQSQPVRQAGSTSHLQPCWAMECHP